MRAFHHNLAIDPFKSSEPPFYCRRLSVLCSSTPTSPLVFLCCCCWYSFQPFKLNNGVSPNNNRSHIFPSSRILGFFQDDIQKGIITSQRSNHFTIAIERKLKSLVLESEVCECMNESAGRIRQGQQNSYRCHIHLDYCCWGASGKARRRLHATTRKRTMNLLRSGPF